MADTELVQGEMVEDECLDDLEVASSAAKDIYTFAAQLPRSYRVKLDEVDYELAKAGKKFSRIKSAKAIIDKAHARYVPVNEPVEDVPVENSPTPKAKKGKAKK